MRWPWKRKPKPTADALIEELAERLYLRDNGWPYPSQFWASDVRIAESISQRDSYYYGDVHKYRERARLAYAVLTGNPID